MRAPTLAALVLAACGGTAGPPGFSSGPPVTSAPESTSGSSSTGDASSTAPANDSTGSSGSSDTGILRDVGTAIDFGPVQPLGCQGKVDILFVISRLGTMVTEQTQLLASFPGFIDTIEQKLEGFDVHILTANPDGLWPGYDVCEGGDGGCSDYWPNCGPYALDYDCATYKNLVTKCDMVLGAGLTFNVGGSAANKLCDLHGGHRYIVGDEPDMAGAFECIAKVGVSGDALMGDAMIAAISPELNGPGGCNEGFLRDDALLVVVLITDSQDTESKSYDKSQYDAILAAKGDSDAVVMLAIVRNPPGDIDPPPTCMWDQPSYGIFEDLLARFPYAVFGDTCSPNYASFFEEAAGKISEACESFIPQ